MLNTDPVHAALLQYDRAAPPDGGPPLGDGEAAPIPGETLSFMDVVRGLNPLQHLPVVGTIYRALTGDEIQPAFRVLGGALFGGPAGMAIAAFTVSIEQFQPATRALALLRGEEDPLTAPRPQQVANAYTAYGQFGQIESSSGA